MFSINQATSINIEFSSARNGESYNYPSWEVLLTELAGIPRTCSPSYLKDSNGYFNCEITWDANDAISSVGQSSMNPSVAVALELIL